MDILHQSFPYTPSTHSDFIEIILLIQFMRQVLQLNVRK